MSTLLKRKVKTGRILYRLWSTIVDSWKTDWLTRDEVLNYLEENAISRVKKDFEQERLRFPLGWTDKDTNRVFNESDMGKQ